MRILSTPCCWSRVLGDGRKETTDAEGGGTQHGRRQQSRVAGHSPQTPLERPILEQKARRGDAHDCCFTSHRRCPPGEKRRGAKAEMQLLRTSAAAARVACCYDTTAALIRLQLQTSVIKEPLAAATPTAAVVVVEMSCFASRLVDPGNVLHV